MSVPQLITIHPLVTEKFHKQKCHDGARGEVKRIHQEGTLDVCATFYGTLSQRL